MTFGLTDIFLLLGSFLAMLMAVLLVINPRIKGRANTVMAFLLLVLGLASFISAMFISHNIRVVPWLLRLDSPLHFLIAPLVYIYIKTSFTEDYRLGKWGFLHFLPASFNFLECLPLYLSDNTEKLEIIEGMLDGSVALVMPYHFAAKVLLGIGYLILQVRELRRYSGKIKEFSSYINERYLGWMWVFNGLFGLFLLFLLIPAVLSFFYIPFGHALATIILFFFTLASVIGLFFYPEVMYAMPMIKEEEQAEPVKSPPVPILDESRKQIADQLLAEMEERRPYLQSKLTLHRLAEMTQIPPHQLSRVINDDFDKNFMDFINTYRVEHAKQILDEGGLSQLTIAGIAKEAGFNSRTAFYNAFKKNVGMVPTAYVRSKSTQ